MLPLRPAALGLLLLCSSCAPGFDSARATPERGSLGAELFGLVCDRIGAQSLREDVTGASYDPICHRRTERGFANEVDRSALPALASSDESVRKREQGIARIEVLAEERDALVEAFDAMLPDQLLTLGNSSARLHETLPQVLAELVPLYEDETVPRVTRALGALSQQVERDASIATALARLAAREGYRPDALALYVLRPVLSYPRLFELGEALARVHRDDSHGVRSKLLALFGSTARSIESALLVPGAPQAKLHVATDLVTGLTVPTRARSARELSLSLLSDEGLGQGDSLFSIVRRDARGVAEVLRRGDTLPYPFVADSTNAPQLDGLGRFVTVDRLHAPLPFSKAADSLVPRDVLGRALGDDGQPLYATLDVRDTLLRELSSALTPLFRPRMDAGKEATFDALRVVPALLGDSVRRNGALVFDAESAPLVDLAHAFGATVARPEIEEALALFAELSRKDPALVARLARLLLNLDSIADRYPKVSLRPESTFWDEMIEVLTKVAQNEGLLEDILGALEDPRTQELGPVFAAYMRNRDDLTYARDDGNRGEVLNGKVYNQTQSDFSDMHTPVDRNAPDTGTNRSIVQRFLALLHDANGLSACSKDNAIAHVDIRWPPGRAGVPIRLNYPTDVLAKTVCAFVGSRAPSRIAECGILRFDNVAELIVDVVTGDVEIEVRDDCLSKLMVSPLAQVVGGADAFLEDISGIRGFNLHPTVQGVARLAFFEAGYDTWGGYAGEGYYPKTYTFLTDVLAPVPSMVCKAERYQDPSDGKEMSLRRCDKFEDTLRGRHRNGLFPLEQLGFLEKVLPLAEAFGRHDATPLFVELLDVLHLHWADERQTKLECDKTVGRGDARYCTQDGLVAYEPMLADMLEETELLRELSVLSEALKDARIPHCSARAGDGSCTQASERDGFTVVAEAMRALVDPERSAGLTDRRGESRARRNDGSYSGKATPLTLWLDALARLDQRERSNDDAHKAWLRARSEWIDALLEVEGTPDSPRFVLTGLQSALPLALNLMREQIVAHCPDRKPSCLWARRDLVRSVSELVEDPVTADLFAALDALAQDAPARIEVGRFLAHLLSDLPDQATQASILAALIDLLQVSDDHEGVRPLLKLLAHALGETSAEKADNALVPSFLELLSRFFQNDAPGARDEIDPYRALETVLRNTVMPMGKDRPAPFEVLASVVARVNRQDPRARGAYEPADFQRLTHELAMLLLDEESGFEQLYAILAQTSGR